MAASVTRGWRMTSSPLKEGVKTVKKLVQSTPSTPVSSGIELDALPSSRPPHVVLQIETLPVAEASANGGDTFTTDLAGDDEVDGASDAQHAVQPDGSQVNEGQATDHAVGGTVGNVDGTGGNGGGHGSSVGDGTVEIGAAEVVVEQQVADGTTSASSVPSEVRATSLRSRLYNFVRFVRFVASCILFVVKHVPLIVLGISLLGIYTTSKIEISSTIDMEFWRVLALYLFFVTLLVGSSRALFHQARRSSFIRTVLRYGYQFVTSVVRRDNGDGQATTSAA